VRKLKADNSRIDQEYKVQLHTKDVMYEDLRSFCMQRHQFVLEMQEIIKQREEQIEIHEHTIAKLEGIVEQHEASIEKLQDEK
jgi:hypothetical protein